MINIILHVLFILFVTLLSGYIIFCVLFYLVKKNVEQELKTKRLELEQWQTNLKSQDAQFEQRKNQELQTIIQKQNETVKNYQLACNHLIASEKNRDDLQLKITALQKRNDQLQSELYQSRKRAERLANKGKNPV